MIKIQMEGTRVMSVYDKRDAQGGKGGLENCD
jgi:hypothetical protein